MEKIRKPCHMFSNKKNRKKKGGIYKTYNRYIFHYILRNKKYTKSFNTRKEAEISQKLYILFYPLIEFGTKKPTVNTVIHCLYCNTKMKRSFLTRHLKNTCRGEKNDRKKIEEKIEEKEEEEEEEEEEYNYYDEEYGDFIIEI